MKSFFFGVLVGVTAALVAGVVHGRECEGISFPEETESAGATLKLNGLGLRQATFLKVNVYVAALYLAETSSDPNAILESTTPKELILHFVRDVDQAELRKGWDEGFEHNAKGQLPALKERIEAFKRLMADMKSGQRLGFAYKEGAGVAVGVDNEIKGEIEGDDFARALYSIWLGTHPPNAELKAGLLGGTCE